MFLRHLALEHYGIFSEASFDLRTDLDHPIVLISGNNGAGKTSFLEALRIALHGRRAFDIPMGEVEYRRIISSRFHLRDLTRRCAVTLDFDYIDLHKKCNVVVERSWVSKGQTLTEVLRVCRDGKDLSSDDADDLLNSIVPPEIARYFFFDGERIRELAEWEVEDESALFSAVADLLGLGVLDQLRADLIRLCAIGEKGKTNSINASSTLEAAETRFSNATSALRVLKLQTRKLRGALDRARAEVRRVGAMHHDEIAALESELGQLIAERRGIVEEAQRLAGDVLPLVCAKNLRSRFGKEIAVRRRLEDRAVVARFLEENSDGIAVAIKSAANGKPLPNKTVNEICDAIVQLAYGEPESVSGFALPDLSRADAAWMQRVIERELPEMEIRTRDTIERLRFLDAQIEALSVRKSAIPINDPTGEDALRLFEERQREFLKHEALIHVAEIEQDEAVASLLIARDAAKMQRLDEFRRGRIRVRERVMGQILDALPTLSERLQSSKEERFGAYLRDALRELWHKTERLVGVEVSFSERRIALLDAYGEIQKQDLSAGEKQLFAVAFIYALAKLSGRKMPFVIDTPLGRLDQQHRQRFVAEFLPKASHQVILLSTDTEIVGHLYDKIQPLLAQHHDLSDFNGGVSGAVKVATA